MTNFPRFNGLPEQLLNLTGRVQRLERRSQPISSRIRSTTQAIPNGVWTTVVLDQAIDDKGIPYSGGLWTIPKLARYSLTYTVTYWANTTGRRIARLLLNGSVVFGQTEVGLTTVGSGAAGPSLTFSINRTLPAGTTVALQTYQSITGGGSLTTQLDSTNASIACLGT